MPRVSAFAALRYGRAAGDPSGLIAPPYDVIDAALARELRERSPYNAVRLVLPEDDGNDRYAAAAGLIGDWRRAGVLVEDDASAVYAYRQRYDLDGHRIERLALFGALELEPDGRGVLPHERTHAGPRADRLALTLATRTQLSPVFLLARDPGAALLETLRLLQHAEPSFATSTPDGVHHALWPIYEEGVVAVLCALAGRHPLLIADGHHRYETAVEVARRLDSEAAGRVLACIVSAEDPGLVIRPTHRTLTTLHGMTPTELPDRLEQWFVVERLGPLDPARAEREAAADPGRTILLTGSHGRGAEPVGWRLSPLPDQGADAAGERVGYAGGEAAEADVRAAAGIAAVRFDRHVIRDLLGTDADTAAHEGLLEYHREAADAVRRAGRSGAAFILPAVGLDAVWKASAAGIRLPPKSTYFEPKVPSGLLFRPL